MLGQNHRLNVTKSVGPPKSWPMGLFNNCVYSKIQVLIISFPNNYNFVQVKHVRRNPHRATQHFGTSPANVAAAAHSAAAPLSRARGVHGAAPRSVPTAAARCWVGPRVAWVESGVPMDLQGWSEFFGYLFLSHCQTRLSQWLWKFLVTGWMNICLSAIFVVRPGAQGSRVSFGSHTHVQRHTKKTWRCWIVPLQRTFVAITAHSAHSARKVQ